MVSKKLTYKFHREFPISILSFAAYHWQILIFMANADNHE